jgi:hypothetical protein
MAALSDTLREHDTGSGAFQLTMSKPTPRAPGHRCDESRLTKPVPGEAIAT